MKIENKQNLTSIASNGTRVFTTDSLIRSIDNEKKDSCLSDSTQNSEIEEIGSYEQDIREIFLINVLETSTMPSSVKVLKGRTDKDNMEKASNGQLKIILR